MKVIVNADDLGISHFVNSEIEKAINNGVVTSSTLIVNAPSFEEGVAIAKRHSEISVGLHLNLVEFAPLTDYSIFQKYGIVDNSGFFIEGAISYLNDYPEDLIEAVKKEWTAQIERFMQNGLVPSHIDSHQHTHTIPAFQKVLIELMNNYGIKKVRRRTCPKLLFLIFFKVFGKTKVHYKEKAIERPKSRGTSKFIGLIKSLIKTNRWNSEMKKHFALTDQFWGYSSFIDSYRIQSLKRNSTVELMCHPGLDGCEQENDILFDGALGKKKGVELISYNQYEN